MPYTGRMEPPRGKDTRQNLDVGSHSQVPHAAGPTILGSVNSQKSQYCFLGIPHGRAWMRLLLVTEKS